MSQLIFVTGNAEKFEIAQAACEPFGIHLVQSSPHIDEIQAEDSETVICDKAQKAFAILGEPLVVSDDSWSIPGLHGFPGPYMKSIAHWFTPEDWLNLTLPLADKRVILVQLLVLQDGNGQQLFRKEYTAHFLPEARGNYGTSFQKVVTVPDDKGLSIAEAYDAGANRSQRKSGAGWHDLAEWYTKKATT